MSWMLAIIAIMHLCGGYVVCSAMLGRGYVKTKMGAVICFNLWLPLVVLSLTRLGDKHRV